MSATPEHLLSSKVISSQELHEKELFERQRGTEQIMFKVEQFGVNVKQDKTWGFFLWHLHSRVCAIGINCRQNGGHRDSACK
jgi:hypothetical protein